MLVEYVYVDHIVVEAVHVEPALEAVHVEPAKYVVVSVHVEPAKYVVVYVYVG